LLFEVLHLYADPLENHMQMQIPEI